MTPEERFHLINETENYNPAPNREGDLDTRSFEVGNGALIEVTATLDADGDIDGEKPIVAFYKGVQINDLMHDEYWDIVHKEWSDAV